MVRKSCWKNWAATICVLADQAVSLRSVVFGVGHYDGTRRDHFFQGLANKGGNTVPSRIGLLRKVGFRPVNQMLFLFKRDLPFVHVMWGSR
jgi:hypothetical protein